MSRYFSAVPDFFEFTIPATKLREFAALSEYFAINVVFFIIISPLIVIFGVVVGNFKYGIKCDMSCPTLPFPLVYSLPFAVPSVVVPSVVVPSVVVPSVVNNALIPSNLHDNT